MSRTSGPKSMPKILSIGCLAIVFLVLLSACKKAPESEAEVEETAPEIVEAPKLPQGFVSTWNTRLAAGGQDTHITLPLVESGTYDFTVDWGDGTRNHITAWDQE